MMKLLLKLLVWALWFLAVVLITELLTTGPFAQPSGYSITNRREAAMPDYVAIEEEALQARGVLLAVQAAPLGTILEPTKRRQP